MRVGRRLGLFWDPFWRPILIILCEFWGSKPVKMGLKRQHFYRKAPGGSLELSWEPSLLSWASLEWVGAPDFCKQQHEDVRYFSRLVNLLETILAHFKPFWTPKSRAKFQYKLVQTNV